MGKECSGILHHLVLRHKQIQIIMDRNDTVLSANAKHQQRKKQKTCCDHQIPS